MDIPSPTATMDIARLQAARSTPGIEGLTGKNEAELRRTAEDFEAVFVHQFLEAMWTGVKTDGPFGGGHSEGIYRSMLNDEFAKSITGQGGIGLADQIYRELVGLQEVGGGHRAPSSDHREPSLTENG
ncbi:MAG: rod-binding protein [Pseudomonadota bacterium]